MKRFLFVPLFFIGVGLLLVLTTPPVRAAATLSQQIDPPEANVGDEVTLTFTVQNGADASIQMPHVDGLQVAGSSSSTNIIFANGTLSSAVSQVFTLIPRRAGDFTIPTFDVQLGNGEILHAHAMKLHVVTNGAPAPAGNGQPAGGAFPFPNGPVVMPSVPVPDQNDQTPDSNPPAAAASTVTPPTDSDGQPAKVFMVITPKTTNAYVGETIPMRIEFYIRMDSLAQQDSLPTIKGSDFLMNDLSVRPNEDAVALGSDVYHRETWVTAISAVKSGDFPLEMERDTYWTKSSQAVFSDPLAALFNSRSNLAHANIPSNKLVIHARSLPEEGRPPGFTGAIGQFRAAGHATAGTVNVGDPVYLDFNIDGVGNFDHVNSPALAPDPAWKAYVASSKIRYTDESHTEGEKDFHQAIIPRQNGSLPLPAASFSYFEPLSQKYITIPIPLPTVTVTGAPQPQVAAPSSAPDASTLPASAALPTLSPNRLAFGTLQPSLIPLYHQPWYWLAQGLLLLLLLATAIGLSVTSQSRRDQTRAESALRRRSQQELEAAMSSAVQRQDANGFFLSARRLVQVHYGALWHVSPEAVTLPEISARDPHLAELAAPLFHQADEVMYSGSAPGQLDLAEWERRVREDLLQAQPA